MNISQAHEVMNTERKPVDVLAVMDNPIAHADKFGAHRGFVTIPVNDLREARAAVAELIEAAQQAREYLCEKAPGTATEYRISAALARCGVQS